MLMRDENLANFCCPNGECRQYGVFGGDNICVRTHYGQNRTRLLECRVCKQAFSERRGTILENSRLATEKVLAILTHIADGKSQRAITRLLGVGRDTVNRYSKMTVEDRMKLHDEIVASLSERRKTPARGEVGLDPKRKSNSNVFSATQLLSELFSQIACRDECVEINITDLIGRLPHLRNKRERANRRTLDRVLKATGIKYAYVFGKKEYTFEGLTALRLRKRRYGAVKIVFECVASLTVSAFKRSEK